MSEQIHRVSIWSGWLRLSHLAVGLSTLILASTGWLIRNAPTVAEDAVDIHYYASSLLIFGIVLRLVLAISGSPVERISALLPKNREWPSVKEMLIFYITLGRSTLPRWHAHNPLWKLPYLIVYLLLILLIFSGWLMPNKDIVLGWYLPSLHRGLAELVIVLTTMHLITAVFHDYKGGNSDVSAIINGHRYFLVERKPGEQVKITDSVTIRPDQIGK